MSDAESMKALFPSHDQLRASQAAPPDGQGGEQRERMSALFPSHDGLRGEAWHDELLRDPEVTANLEAARALVKEHGNPELQKLLDSTSLGNNPGLVRFLVKLAKDRGGR
jgi:hypothetical protein